MKALDRHGRVTTVPFQKPGAPESVGLTPAACAAAAWAVDAEGRRYRGAGAVHAALAWALGAPILLKLYALPLIRPAADAIYGWVAAHRSRLPGVTPHCAQHPEDCGGAPERFRSQDAS